MLTNLLGGTGSLIGDLTLPVSNGSNCITGGTSGYEPCWIGAQATSGMTQISHCPFHLTTYLVSHGCHYCHEDVKRKYDQLLANSASTITFDLPPRFKKARNKKLLLLIRR